MAKRCERCERGLRFAVKRSYSMRASSRKQRPNLQWAWVEGRRIRVCSRCLGALKKEGKISPPRHSGATTKQKTKKPAEVKNEAQAPSSPLRQKTGARGQQNSASASAPPAAAENRRKQGVLAPAKQNKVS